MNDSLLFRLSDNNPFIEEDDYHCTKMDIHVLSNELKMLLTSRARLSEIESIEDVNSSILNYGFDESLNQISDISTRRSIIKNRLLNALSRFEPRLTQVSLSSTTDEDQKMRFDLHAWYLQTPITLELTWDDYMGKFFFNE